MGLSPKPKRSGRLHLIDCKDLNEAMSIAARIPTLTAGGAVEMRSIEEMEL